MVADVAQAQEDKLPALVVALEGAGILRSFQGDPGSDFHAKAFPIVVGTHPHDDHIGGMATFLELFGTDVPRCWEGASL